MTMAAPLRVRTRVGRSSVWRTLGPSLALALSLFALGSLPYVYAAWSCPADRVYTGLMFDVPDHAQYWSWVTASRSGLFISNTMTPEPNGAIFMNPQMWLLARVQSAFGLSFPALFQVWRAGATMLLAVALIAFLRALVPDRDRRRTAAWLAIAGAGFGWLLVVAKAALHLADVPFPMDLYVVEPNTFFALLAYPHLLLAQALLLATLLGVWKAFSERGWRGAALGGVGALGLALSHPYDLLTVYAIVGVFACWVLGRTRAVPWRLVAAGAVVAACSGPVAFYYQNLTAHDPLWRSVLAQYSNAGVWTPKHLHLVVLMGLPLLLAAVGLVRPTGRDDRFRFLAAWAAVGLLLIYLPVVYQIKFLGGWQFPLAILGATAWHDRVAPWLDDVLRRLTSSRERRQQLARALLVVLVIPTNVYLFSWRFVELRRHASPYYLHRDEAAALDWLSQHATSSDVVLAPEAIGQFVPNYGGTRAYLAHWAMTNRYHERAAKVVEFFDASTPDSWRSQLLGQEGVTMVLRAGAANGGGAAWEPHGAPFEPVLQLPRAQVYRVRLARGAEQPTGGR